LNISYRISAGFVIMAALLNGAVSAISGNPYIKNPGCGELQLTDVARFSGIVAFPLLVIILLRGIRSRPVPRALAGVALIALLIAAQSQLTRITNCETAGEIITTILWMLTLVVMCLHQIIQQTQPENPPADRP
jgi:hypothetical protein